MCAFHIFSWLSGSVAYEKGQNNSLLPFPLFLREKHLILCLSICHLTGYLSANAMCVEQCQLPTQTHHRTTKPDLSRISANGARGTQSLNPLQHPFPPCAVPGFSDVRAAEGSAHTTYIRTSTVRAFPCSTRKCSGAPLACIKAGTHATEVFILSLKPIRLICAPVSRSPCFGTAHLQSSTAIRHMALLGLPNPCRAAVF